MSDKYGKNNNFFRIPKDEDSIVWKEIINHRKYILELVLNGVYDMVEMFAFGQIIGFI